MKRILAILLALTMLFVFVACDNTSTSADADASSTATAGDTVTPSATPGDSTIDNTGAPTETNASTPTATAVPGETAKPTATATNKPTETHTHNWGNWTVETKALVGKDGTEKRTCSGCSEVEKRSTTKGALINSFSNDYLQEYFVFCAQDGGNATPFNTNALLLVGDLIARDLCYKGTAAEIATSTIPVNDYYNALKEYFVVNDSIINQMKATRSGNAYAVTMNGFTPGYLYYIEGYVHNGGNKYTVYYNCDDNGAKPMKVEIEYNLLNNKPNRYISIEKVNSIPSNITQ